MAGEVRLNLSLSFRQESQIPPVSRHASQDTKRQRPPVPKGVEQTFPPTQFRNSLLGPSQVLGFFISRAVQSIPDKRVARRERLPLVERLSTNFATVIDAHQTERMPLFFGRQVCLR